MANQKQIQKVHWPIVSDNWCIAFSMIFLLLFFPAIIAYIITFFRNRVTNFRHVITSTIFAFHILFLSIKLGSSSIKVNSVCK